MPRTRRCSQCGQEGHNKRNRMCLVNMERELANVAITPSSRATRARVGQCRYYFNRAADIISALSQYIEYYQIQSTIPDDFAMTAFDNINAFCEKINVALQYDIVDRPLIRPALLFQYLSTHVELINTILDTIAQSPFRVVVYLQGREFSVCLVNISPAANTHHNVKRSSAYLKEISLVQDLAVPDNVDGCDCPLCFEEISATDAIVAQCKHSFCAPCIKGYSFAIKDSTKKPNCPMCRADITQFKIGNVEIYEDIREHLLKL